MEGKYKDIIVYELWGKFYDFPVLFSEFGPQIMFMTSSMMEKETQCVCLCVRVCACVRVYLWGGCLTQTAH